MKKISTILFGLLMMVACSQEQPKEYLTISGKLENSKDSIISIADRKGIIKEIKINTDGSFKDTLKLKDNKGEIYTLLTSSNKRAPIYLKNGYNLSLNTNTDTFLESIKFSGEGASNSNFILAQIERSQKMGNPQLILDLEQKAFRKKVDKIKADFDSILDSYNNIDTALYTSIKQQNQQIVTYFDNAYAQNRMMAKGRPSPTFENYVDIKGGTKSLNSFKGKYVYIDVWATWCGPCIQQIPYLQALEKEYHNKNITFVSISTDESRRSGGSWEAAEKKWRDFVKKRNMSGVQLWAGQDYSFQQDYQISGIPRFILIDPQGNIVNANAPRPSDPNLKSLFTSLGI
ncbi:redoxin [Polaribacter reichenbachii]|uniref:Redoxin n=1 Tax=Polaribacter reichenbachii TaxID=996801 RepID=A0A1B8U0A3_9FLAO|nr:TlpA disulfide reductase family protein [Polaribacter reichenbachii]APZ47044.1 redoxin [Polaribacter reichenbachii]AUC17686.1 redoxin [Polaribacter reichenbachii]OBY65291.1 redoxin [Polaribacter reichenbachii]